MTPRHRRRIHRPTRETMTFVGQLLLAIIMFLALMAALIVFGYTVFAYWHR